MPMNEDHLSKASRLKQLEQDNQFHNERALAAQKLCSAWQQANSLLLSQGHPPLTLEKYKESIHYVPDDALVFLAGADEVWLKNYLERVKQRQQASKIYNAGQTISAWVKIGEFARRIAIGILIAFIIGIIILLLY
jgi:hypothetical protein